MEGSGGLFGPFGQKNRNGDALIEKWQPKNMEEEIWKASEKMVKEKGFEMQLLLACATLSISSWPYTLYSQLQRLVILVIRECSAGPQYTSVS